MNFLNISDKKAEISFSYNDLLILNAVFNEVCNGIDVFEFETRIGATKEEVGEFLKITRKIIDQMKALKRIL